MADDVKKTLIQVRREARKLSRSQFAKLLGVTPGYIKVVEKMKVQPSTELLDKVGEELGIPYEKLVAEYRKKGGAPAAPPSRRRTGRRQKTDSAPKQRAPRFSNAPSALERPIDGATTPLFPTAAPLVAVREEQDELLSIALRSQQGVEILLRAVNERNNHRPARSRALVRQYQQLLAELVALTARVAVSEAERKADEEEIAAGGTPETGPFRSATT